MRKVEKLVDAFNEQIYAYKRELKEKFWEYAPNYVESVCDHLEKYEFDSPAAAVYIYGSKDLHKIVEDRSEKAAKYFTSQLQKLNGIVDRAYSNRGAFDRFFQSFTSGFVTIKDMSTEKKTYRFVKRVEPHRVEGRAEYYLYGVSSNERGSDLLSVDSRRAEIALMTREELERFYIPNRLSKSEIDDEVRLDRYPDEIRGLFEKYNTETENN